MKKSDTINTMDFVTMLGLFNAFMGMITFLPQVIQVVKTKQTKNLSLVTYVIIVINTITWSLYGYLRSDFPVILVNVLIFINAGIILIYKFKYG